MADVPMNMPLPGQPLTEDLKCARCGYNLRGLTLDKLCPECATPIARSIHGNLLQYADPDWVEKLRFGTALMFWHMLIGVSVGGSVAGITVIGLPQALTSILGIIAGVLGLWAAFLITTPEPVNALSEHPMTLRKLVRACAIANFCGVWVQEAGKIGGLGVVIMVVGGILALVGIVSYFGFFVYLRRFALRIPDESLAAQTRVVMWGFVVGMALLVALGIVLGIVLAALVPGAVTTRGGPGIGAATATAATEPGPLAFMWLRAFAYGGPVAVLVFGIWYIVLLFRYHAAFKEAAQ